MAFGYMLDSKSFLGVGLANLVATVIVFYCTKKSEHSMYTKEEKMMVEMYRRKEKNVCLVLQQIGVIVLMAVMLFIVCVCAYFYCKEFGSEIVSVKTVSTPVGVLVKKHTHGLIVVFESAFRTRLAKGNLFLATFNAALSSFYNAHFSTADPAVTMASQFHCTVSTLMYQVLIRTVSYLSYHFDDIEIKQFQGVLVAFVCLMCVVLALAFIFEGERGFQFRLRQRLTDHILSLDTFQSAQLLNPDPRRENDQINHDEALALLDNQQFNYLKQTDDLDPLTEAERVAVKSGMERLLLKALSGEAGPAIYWFARSTLHCLTISLTAGERVVFRDVKEDLKSCLLQLSTQERRFLSYFTEGSGFLDLISREAQPDRTHEGGGAAARQAQQAVLENVNDQLGDVQQDDAGEQVPNTSVQDQHQKANPPTHIDPEPSSSVATSATDQIKPGTPPLSQGTASDFGSMSAADTQAEAGNLTDPFDRPLRESTPAAPAPGLTQRPKHHIRPGSNSSESHFTTTKISPESTVPSVNTRARTAVTELGMRGRPQSSQGMSTGLELSTQNPDVQLNTSLLEINRTTASTNLEPIEEAGTAPRGAQRSRPSDADADAVEAPPVLEVLRAVFARNPDAPPGPIGRQVKGWFSRTRGAQDEEAPIEGDAPERPAEVDNRWKFFGRGWFTRRAHLHAEGRDEEAAIENSSQVASTSTETAGAGSSSSQNEQNQQTHQTHHEN